MSVVRLSIVASFAAPFAVLLLAACSDGAAPVADQDGDATGEILPGSVSDDMIATDSLSSQPPQLVEAPENAAGGAGGAPAAAGGAPTAETEVEVEAAAEPAQVPELEE